MFKIKLLILLLINLTIFGCTKNTKKAVNTFNVGYIESDVDGLIAYNFFESHLNSFSALNNQSKFKIYGTISHSGDLYITNINNTSDREKITSTLEISITNNDCIVYKSINSIAQFYLIASSTKFKSNTDAIKKIKTDNTELLVKNVINEILDSKLNCIDDSKS